MSKGKDKKTWTDNLLQYTKTGSAGNCPKCGSEDIDIEEYRKGKRQSLFFLCKNCGSFDHFDGFRY